ncbi:MAG: hypothetical protein KKB31_00030 [Nanoarchaeota archaeon]|nr:hypothetical protein [Nanoarchaeota archaeon]
MGVEDLVAIRLHSDIDGLGIYKRVDDGTEVPLRSMKKLNVPEIEVIESFEFKNGRYQTVYTPKENLVAPRNANALLIGRQKPLGEIRKASFYEVDFSMQDPPLMEGIEVRTLSSVA